MKVNSNILFLNKSPNPNGSTAALAKSLLDGQTYDTQGAAPEEWMQESREYTMRRFAGLYGMEYVGMATNAAQAKVLSTKL